MNKSISISWSVIIQEKPDYLPDLLAFLGSFRWCLFVMIIGFKLTYPSGPATAHLINSFHTPAGAKLAKGIIRPHALIETSESVGQVLLIQLLLGFLSMEMVVDLLSSPHLVLKHMKTTTYVGVGMICPYIINISVLLGGILSWGLMWPLIDTKKGDWYPADLKPGSLHGLQGYKVFIATALILGDGLYNFFKVLSRTLAALFFQLRGRDATGALPIADSSPKTSRISYDEQRYVTIAAISTATVPHIFPELKWYYILVIYIFAPALAFCNAYGCGLTDWSLASTYGTLAIFVIGAWAGASHGGVLAGLAACGVMMNIVSTASDLSQDFKTGYLTLSSPRSMFVSQLIGTAMGCMISPCVFWLFFKAFKDLGTPFS
ncbi:hypothetical protein NC651_037760 [Populus alba x Populus x berolinensis]|nr:hypothetical protein NC651_037760 [Populus alba x Populus x berolinensis]